MELDWIGKDSIWSSNLHWNEGWKLIILELMSNNDSMWIRTQINRWAWPDHCWYNVMYLKNSILSCQLQFALRWRLRDSISRFKVNWSLSQSCFVFVLVLILLFVLSVWVFQLLVVHGFERLKRDWTSDRCLAGRPRGEDGPMGRPALGEEKSTGDALGEAHMYQVGCSFIANISICNLWTTLNQGKTDFQGRPNHFVNLFYLKQRRYAFLRIELTWFWARREKFSWLSHHVFR